MRKLIALALFVFGLYSVMPETETVMADCTAASEVDSNGRAVTSNRLFLAYVVIPCTGTLDSIRFYAHNSDGTVDTMISAIYLASSRALIARSVDSVLLTTASYLSYKVTFTGVNVTASTAYWAGQHIRTGATGAHRGTQFVNGVTDSVFIGDDALPLEANMSGITTTGVGFYPGSNPTAAPPKMKMFITTATGQASVVLNGGVLESVNFCK